jgi:hypothetical protein
VKQEIEGIWVKYYFMQVTDLERRLFIAAIIVLLGSGFASWVRKMFLTI